MSQLLQLHHLVGRQEELSALQNFLSAEVDAHRKRAPNAPNRGGCMVVTGQAGVGKTRLVQEAMLDAQGWKLVHGTCSKLFAAYGFMDSILRTLFKCPIGLSATEEEYMIKKKLMRLFEDDPSYVHASVFPMMKHVMRLSWQMSGCSVMDLAARNASNIAARNQKLSEPVVGSASEEDVEPGEDKEQLPVDSLGIMVTLIRRIQKRDFSDKHTLLVLVLEDAHLLDTASVRLVHRLLEAGMTMVLALRDNSEDDFSNASAVGAADSLEYDGTTFMKTSNEDQLDELLLPNTSTIPQPRESSMDWGAETTPAPRQYLVNLINRPSTSTLYLDQMSEAQIKSMIEAALSLKDIPAEVARSVHRMSLGGNPFWCRQILHCCAGEMPTLKGQIEGGELNERVAAYIEKLARFENPRKFLEERCKRLSEAQLAILQASAVIGMEVRVSMLKGVLPRKFRKRLTQDLTGLVRQQLLRAMTPAAFTDNCTTTQSTHFSATERKWTFPHVLLRYAILSNIPVEQRKGYHRSVGNLFEKIYDEDLRPYYTTMCHHFVASKLEPLKSAMYAVKSASISLVDDAWEECMQFAVLSMTLVRRDVEQDALLATQVMRCTTQDLMMPDDVFDARRLPQLCRVGALQQTIASVQPATPVLSPESLGSELMTGRSKTRTDSHKIFGSTAKSRRAAALTAATDSLFAEISRVVAARNTEVEAGLEASPVGGAAGAGTQALRQPHDKSSPPTLPSNAPADDHRGTEINPKGTGNKGKVMPGEVPPDAGGVLQQQQQQQQQPKPTAQRAVASAAASAKGGDAGGDTTSGVGCADALRKRWKRSHNNAA